ncbi:hypothetical protein B0H15DRAFT_428088 [Mycena belliarum]|uniref:Uncharacterized protein n=1 Tax=Mycena belliarum TaxID=1033014 RepID=A0AAD6XP13_9AGAR|nr:hypothetical protein B0H15DRAFT_428088 [Mycena belliae]
MDGTVWLAYGCYYYQFKYQPKLQSIGGLPGRGLKPMFSTAAAVAGRRTDDRFVRLSTSRRRVPTPPCRRPRRRRIGIDDVALCITVIHIFERRKERFKERTSCWHAAVVPHHSPPALRTWSLELGTPPSKATSTLTSTLTLHFANISLAFPQLPISTIHPCPTPLPFIGAMHRRSSAPYACTLVGNHCQNLRYSNSKFRPRIRTPFDFVAYACGSELKISKPFGTIRVDACFALLQLASLVPLSDSHSSRASISSGFCQQRPSNVGVYFFLLLSSLRSGGRGRRTSGRSGQGSAGQFFLRAIQSRDFAMRIVGDTHAHVHCTQTPFPGSHFPPKYLSLSPDIGTDICTCT